VVKLITTKRSNSYIKIICIVCLILSIAALVVARNSPATAYEPSLYNATPLFVWIALFINLICGVSIVIHQIYTKRFTKGNLWFLGLLLILLSYTTILALWIIRGYALWCLGDPATHLGMIQDIISSGRIGQGNFYPIIHIFAAEFSYILGVSAEVAQRLIPLIFALLYVPFMYLMAKSLLPHKGQVVMALLISMTFLPNTYLNFTPNFESNLILPVAIFLLMKSFSPGTIQWKILFIIMIFLFPAFHPVSSFALFVILLMIWMGNIIWNTIHGKYLITRFNNLNFDIMFPLLLFIWAIVWLSEFGVWASTILNLKKTILEGGGWITDVVNTINYAEGYGYSVTQYLFKMYSGVFISIVIMLLTIPLLVKKNRFQPSLLKLILLLGPIAVSAIATVLFYFVKVSFGPDRLIVYIVMLSTLFVAFGLHELFELVPRFRINSIFSRLIPFGVIVFLITLSILGAAKLYTSPYIYMDNWQITRTEITGMDWLLHKRDITTDILPGLKVSPEQFAWFLLTQDEHNNQRGSLLVDLRLPYHFGYDNYKTLGQQFAEGTYMVLTDRDKSIYKDIYPEMAKIRFLPQDFEMVNSDITMDKLYTNTGSDVYSVIPSK